jgi:hypothetical protein
MNNPVSKSDHIASLASDLLDDIELGRLSIEQLLLKVTRLARLTGSDEVKQWLGFELDGYKGTDVLSLKYMEITGRWTNKTKKIGYLQSLAGLQAIIETATSTLKTIRIPDISSSITSANPSQNVTNLPQVAII